MSCNICAETFNKSKRTIIKCYCGFECCKECSKTYLLSIKEDACCMSCKMQWDRKFIYENFDNMFITKEYKKHREEILFERELGMLQATQPHVEKEMKIEKINETISKLAEEYTKKLRGLQDELTTIKESETVTKRKFIRKCPNNDCQGFLSTSLKCNLCECFTCGECREIVGFCTEERQQHTCNKEILESVKLLEKDSKACPNCSCLIFKIEGCFAENTPILMWDQSIKMSQDIKKDDILIGDDGKKRIVIKTVKGEDEMYEIKQKNGENYIVNSKHKLILKFSGDKTITWVESSKRWKIKWFCRETLKIKTKDFIVNNIVSKEEAKKEADKFKNKLNFPEEIEILVSDFIKLNKSAHKHLLGFKSSRGIDYDEQKIELDPYLLGLWLGDRPLKASEDIEIQKYIYEWYKQKEAELIHDGLVIIRKMETCDDLRVKTEYKTNSFMEKLAKYNLIRNKQIPKEYLMNSRDIRIKVLAGLIDTDVNVTNCGKRVSIGQVNKTLAENVCILARSLGYIAHTRTEKIKNVKYPKVEVKDYEDNNIVTISSDKLSEIPTLLKRKFIKNLNPNKDYLTSITVRSIGKNIYYGWEVDKNHRFVGIDFTVLRNCDQMYCVECHTAFSWKTLKIETGTIHNPHYYEYQRKMNNGIMPRNPMEIQCGRELDMNFINNLAQVFIQELPKGWTTEQRERRLFNTTMTEIVYINPKGKVSKNNPNGIHPMIEICRKINHIRHVDQQRFLPNNRLNNNLQLRIDYMRKKIQKEEFQKIIQKREKENMKKTEISNVIGMFTMGITDLLYRAYEERDMNILYEMEQLRRYTNECLVNISNMYKCKNYIIDKNYLFR